MNITPVVKQLLIINFIFFIGSQIPNTNAYELFSMHYPESIKFKIWQPLTSMFMHADIMHIFFNMFALFTFGSTLEHFWGGKKFLFFYISCGLGAKLMSTGVNYLQINYLMDSLSTLNFTKSDLTILLNSDLRNVFDDSGRLMDSAVKTIAEKYQFNQEQFNIIFQANALTRTISLGASGAIYGLLVAFAFLFPNSQMFMMLIPIPIKAKYYVIGILTVDLFLGFGGHSLFGRGSTGIGHFAHLGGALIGYIMMWYWKRNQFNHNRWN